MYSENNALENDDAPVEVVDAAGRPLAVLPAGEAHRQSLPHRAALVLFFDTSGRLLLEKRPRDCGLYPGRWDTPARGHIRPGEAAQDAARRLADAARPGLAGQAVASAVLEPSASTGFEVLSVFRCRVASYPPGDSEMAVSGAELAALMQDFRELFTPGLVHAHESGALFREP